MDTELLQATSVGKDFLENYPKFIPTVDSFLTWRNFLDDKKEQNPEYVSSLDKEIEAVDEILRIISSGND